MPSVDAPGFFQSPQFRPGDRDSYRSSFVELTVDEAHAMIAAYWRKNERDCEASRKAFAQCTLDQQASALATLRARLERVLSEDFGYGGVFAKLSSRSPKDSTYARDRAFEIVCRSLLRKRAAVVDVDANLLAAEIMRATIESLKVNSVDELLELFLTSDRICEDDLPLALSFPDSWSQHIVIR